MPFANEPLLASKYKIEGAKAQIKNLHASVKAFQERKPYTFGEEVDPQTGEKLYKVRLAENLPASFYTDTGSALFQLRSALDVLACALAKANGFSDVSGTYFPFGKTKVAFETELRRKTKKLAPEARAAIESLKPYAGGNDLLFVLHDLNRGDKHVDIVPLGMNSAEMLINHIEMHGPGAIYAPSWQNLNDGMIIASTAGEGKVEIDVNISLDIAFAQPEIVQGHPIVATLVQMSDLTEKIVDAFRQRFF